MLSAIVIENFFDNFELLEPEFKKIPLYDFDSFPEKDENSVWPGKTSLQLSTGYVNEDYNAWIEELMLSEKVWITLDGTLYPAKPKTSSQTFKTRLNDSLVAYTVDFDFAFDQIQNIR